MYAIQLKNVSKRFAKQQVLKDVSFAIETGSAAGLVGNNGSGKSVLMKCICGLMIPEQGEIHVDGRRIGCDEDFPSGVGALIESPGFLPGKSGYANLRNLWAIRKKVPISNISESIRLVGLIPEDPKTVGKYSLGMRQRLGIAQAIMENPDILILDEPFNGLDKQGVKEMRELLRRLHASGKTILLASHNAQDIDTLCDEVYEMDAGALTRISPIESTTYCR